MFLNCAIDGQADIIISNDKHLLDVSGKHMAKGSYNAIEVLRADVGYYEILSRKAGKRITQSSK